MPCLKASCEELLWNRGKNWPHSNLRSLKMDLGSATCLFVLISTPNLSILGAGLRRASALRRAWRRTMHSLCDSKNCARFSLLIVTLLGIVLLRTIWRTEMMFSGHYLERKA